MTTSWTRPGGSGDFRIEDTWAGFADGIALSFPEGTGTVALEEIYFNPKRPAEQRGEARKAGQREFVAFPPLSIVSCMFRLAGGEPVSGIDVSFTRSIEITEEDTAPIDAFYRDFGAASGETDGAGRIEAVLWQGSYVMQAGARQHLEISSVPFEVKPGAVIELPERVVTGKPIALFEGTVRVEGGEPWGAYVTVEDSADGHGSAECRPDGHFSVSLEDPHPPFRLAAGFGRCWRRRSPEITLPGPRGSLTLVVPAGYKITGVMTDPGKSGRAFEGRVRCKHLDPGDDCAHEVIADSAGAFEIPDLPPGRYQVEPILREHYSEPVEIAIDNSDVEISLPVRAGSDVILTSGPLPKPAWLTLYLADASGKEVAKEQALLSGEEARSTARFDLLPPGDWRVRVDLEKRSESSTVTLVEVLSASLHLSPGETITLPVLIPR